MNTRLVAESLPPKSLVDLAEGDLVFAAKPSPMLSLLNAVGDSWRHVALVVRNEGELVVGEVTGANRLDYRTLDRVLDSYAVVATARPQLPPSCIRAAAEWANGWVGTSQLYPWDDVVILGLSLLARRVLAVDKVEELDNALRTVARSAPKAQGPAMTCSAFVHAAFQGAGAGCALELTFEPLSPPAASRSMAVPGLFSLDDSDLVSALAAMTVADVVAAYDSQADVSAYVSSTPDPLVEGIPDAGYIGHSKSQMSLAQLARTGRVLYQVLREYSSQYALDDEIDRDSRWVGPGDLWRSSSLTERAVLAIDGRKTV